MYQTCLPVIFAAAAGPNRIVFVVYAKPKPSVRVPSDAVRGVTGPSSSCRVSRRTVSVIRPGCWMAL